MARLSHVGAQRLLSLALAAASEIIPIRYSGAWHLNRDCSASEIDGSFGLK